LSGVHLPISLVVFLTNIASSIGDLSIAMLFTFDEPADVCSAIIISASALPNDFAIDELSNILAAIAHQNYTFSCFFPIVKSPLILKVWVRVSVTALAMAKLSHGVDVTDVPIFGHLVLAVALEIVIGLITGILISAVTRMLNN